MKPAYDKLGDEYEGSKSVLIGDADCTVEQELCSDKGVSGYPTIKYYTEETGPEGAAYEGGRSYEDLKGWVSSNLEAQCDIETFENCSKKQIKFIKEFKGQSAEAIQEKLDGIESMIKYSIDKMKPEKADWTRSRQKILKKLLKLLAA